MCEDKIGRNPYNHSLLHHIKNGYSIAPCNRKFKLPWHTSQYVPISKARSASIKKKKVICRKGVCGLPTTSCFFLLARFLFLYWILRYLIVITMFPLKYVARISYSRIYMFLKMFTWRQFTSITIGVYRLNDIIAGVGNFV